MEHLASAIAAIERRLTELEDLLWKHDRRLVAIAGERGDNGKLGELTREITETGIEVRANSKDIQGLKIKIAVYSAVGSTAGGGIAFSVFQAIQALMR